MRHNRLQARVIGGLIGGGLMALVAMLAGCPNAAGDCRNTLSCPLPSCAEADEGEACISEDCGEDGGADAQED